MMGVIIILLGCVGIYLAVCKFRDFQAGRSEFAPSDTTDLHPLWKRTFKIQLLNAHIDIWIYGILGPFMIIVGAIALFRGD
jgi:hypothetical protein